MTATKRSQQQVLSEFSLLLCDAARDVPTRSAEEFRACLVGLSDELSGANLVATAIGFGTCAGRRRAAHDVDAIVASGGDPLDVIAHVRAWARSAGA